MKISKILTTALIGIALASCTGGSSSTKLGELCEVYAEIAENYHEVADAFQAVYSAESDQQPALQEKATTLSDEVKSKNKILAEKASKLAEELDGTEIKCEVADALGFSIGKATFAVVQAQPKVANIVIEAEVNGDVSQRPYILMLNSDGDILDRTLGSYADGKISINFRITTNRGPANAKNYGQVRSIKIVSETEYLTGKSQTTTAGNSESDHNQEICDIEDNTDPEPVYLGSGSESTSSETVTVNGITIRKGDPLAATLSKFDKIIWDYNTDFGVTATIGNVWIVIDDRDLTEQGQNIINAIPSDMENDISFSVNYIKPSAKITQFEAQ